MAVGCAARIHGGADNCIFCAAFFAYAVYKSKVCAGEGQRVFPPPDGFSIGVLLKLCRVKITLRGLEKLPAEVKWLFVSNHRSNFDPLIAMWALRKYGIAFITKPENLKIPIAGRLMHKWHVHSH